MLRKIYKDSPTREEFERNVKLYTEMAGAFNIKEYDNKRSAKLQRKVLRLLKKALNKIYELYKNTSAPESGKTSSP
jgi:zona occludens toxin (predicted ATPase)